MTKQITIELEIETGQPDYQVKEGVEQILLGSVLSNCEFQLNVKSVVVKEKDKCSLGNNS